MHRAIVGIMGDLRDPRLIYLKGAMFTGYPSHTGILAWARGQFGEYPGGAAGDEQAEDESPVLLGGIRACGR